MNNWSNLRGLGKNKVILNTSIFLTLIPLFVKVQKFAEEILTQLVDKPVSLEIPFSWHLLFFAALSFSTATLLFRLFCPKLIFSYANFSEYQSTGKTLFQFYDYLKSIKDIYVLDKDLKKETIRTLERDGNLGFTITPQSIQDNPFKNGLFQKYQSYYWLSDQYNQEATTRTSTTDKSVLDRRFTGLFYSTYDFVDTHLKKTRLIISTLYAIGGLLMFVILVQNIIFVINELL